MIFVQGSIILSVVAMHTQGSIALDEAQYDYLLAIIEGERTAAVQSSAGGTTLAKGAAVASAPEAVSSPDPSVLRPLISQVG